LFSPKNQKLTQKPKTKLLVCARARDRARAHAPHWTRRRWTSGKMKNKMCQKNVTNNEQRTTTDATIIPAWTQLIVTLCYNNLVSNKYIYSYLSISRCRSRRSNFFRDYFRIFQWLDYIHIYALNLCIYMNICTYTYMHIHICMFTFLHIWKYTCASEDAEVEEAIFFRDYFRIFNDLFTDICMYKYVYMYAYT
jgi:hypothetical protein